MSRFSGADVERRVEQELDAYIELWPAICASARTGGLHSRASRPMPGFCGRSVVYWQVLDEKDGTMLRSVSLWDAELALPNDALDAGATHTHRTRAPDQRDVILHERRARAGYLVRRTTRQDQCRRE